MIHRLPMLLPLVLLAALMGSGIMVERSRTERRSRLSGTFEHQPTILSSRASGRVVEILVQEGQRVKQGQRLLVLENEAGKAELEVLERKVRQARAYYDLVKAGPRTEDLLRQLAVVDELQAQLERLENGPRPGEVREARARYSRAAALEERVRNGPRQEQIAALKASADRERQRAQLARAELDRYRSLFSQGAMSLQEFEKVETEARVADGNHQVAQEALKEALRGSRREDLKASLAERDIAWHQLRVLLEGSRPEDIRAARSRLLQAQAQLSSLRRGSRPEEIVQARENFKAAQFSALSASKKLEETLVRAPLDGVIERLLVSAGDLVAAQAPLFRLTNPQDTWLRVYLPQNQLAKVAIGDLGRLSVDGLHQELSCRVEAIATQGEFTPANLQTPEERGLQVFAIRLRLVEPHPQVKAGMSATVRSLGSWR